MAAPGQVTASGTTASAARTRATHAPLVNTVRARRVGCSAPLAIRAHVPEQWRTCVIGASFNGAASLAKRNACVTRCRPLLMLCLCVAICANNELPLPETGGLDAHVAERSVEITIGDGMNYLNPGRREVAARDRRPQVKRV